MTEKKSSRDDAVQEAITKALDAAAAATDAAHETEAVLLARSDAAKSMERVARRSGWMALAAGGASVAVLVLGGLLVLRSVADLREAGEVQAAAAAAFVERLAEMNGALDRLDLAIAGLEAENTALQESVSAQVAKLDAQLEQMLAKPDPSEEAVGLAEQIDKLRTDMIEALAETQMRLSERIAAPVAKPAPVIVHEAPAPVAVPKPAPKPAPKSKPRPAAAVQVPNPFKYP
ncbi:hypothetical protein [Pseudotabrizicola algicola]|uniref:Uncharacterized protein n=1 Tax=Pseudotabrizicola algicola TaxID=2709381 RepID=A0A6B3RLY3_9RHOB|nr:hypothetical protein [Pseudotabrizicola algicola]NEX45275.1 hypothetical protein [Pseudotabrizicola algicola]